MMAGQPGNYEIISVDRTGLPDALLPTAKTHMRVEFSRDDDYIRLCLMRAIDLFERVSGWRVFPTQVEWMPATASASWQYQCPVQPVTAAKVISADADVSEEYEIRWTTPEAPYYLVHSDKTPFPADADITLTAGFTSMENMEPAALDCVLRIAATLYEQRENVTTPIQLVPLWMNDLLVGTWVPRA